MKQMLTFGLVMVISGCGGGDGFKGNPRGTSGIMPMASGPLSTACMQSDRTARSRALCGCIQAVANETLSGAEQRRAVQFYKNPQMAQDIRQSSRPADQRFWQAYRAYGDRAEQVCA